MTRPRCPPPWRLIALAVVFAYVLIDVLLAAADLPGASDDLLPQSARRGGSELGAAVHRALDAWHTAGGDLLEIYAGPDAGREMLRAYLDHPLARAATYGTELEFNLRLGQARERNLNRAKFLWRLMRRK